MSLPCHAQAFDFRWIRDYEIASTRSLTQEFVLSFDAGEDATEGERKARPATVGGRRKGAYYAPLGGAIQLRKRRPKVRRLGPLRRCVALVPPRRLVRVVGERGSRY